MSACIELLKAIEPNWNENANLIYVKYEQSLIYGKRKKIKLHNYLKKYINMSVNGTHCISSEIKHANTHRVIKLINVDYRKGFVYWAFTKKDAERLMRKVVHPHSWRKFRYYYIDNLEDGCMIRIGY